MKIRDILGSFLFRGDDVEKKVKVLSGGERNRLALAKMLLSDFNVLVMDEPTNHLDIKSKNVLKQALQNFEGTLIIVSHDRDFLQGLTDKVYEFKNKKIKEYLGDIDFYLEQRAVSNFREIEQSKENTPIEKPNAQVKISFEQQKQQKTLQNKLNKIENAITELENELKAMTNQMGESLQSQEFYALYESKKADLDQLMFDWEVLQEQLG